MDRNTPEHIAELLIEQRERLHHVESYGRISEHERDGALEALDGPRGGEFAILFSELQDYQLAMVLSLYHDGLLGDVRIPVTIGPMEFVGACIPD